MRCDTCDSEEVITYTLPTGEIKCHRCRSTIGMDVVGALESHVNRFIGDMIYLGVIDT